VNGPIIRVFGVVLVLFAVLMYFTTRWTVIERDALQDRVQVSSVPHNQVLHLNRALQYTIAWGMHSGSMIRMRWDEEVAATWEGACMAHLHDVRTAQPALPQRPG